MLKLSGNRESWLGRCVKNGITVTVDIATNSDRKKRNSNDWGKILEYRRHVVIIWRGRIITEIILFVRVRKCEYSVNRFTVHRVFMDSSVRSNNCIRKIPTRYVNFSSTAGSELSRYAEPILVEMQRFQYRVT
jgi:hypothetical protein